MKRIGLVDLNNDEIVEGDELNIKLSEDTLNLDYYKFFKIDKVIAKVLDSDGAVGVTISLVAYSKGVEVNTTYQSDLDFMCDGLDIKDQEKQKKELEERLKGVNLKLSDKKREQKISTLNNSIDFAHSFVHKKKKIINKIDNKKRNDALLLNDENLFIQLESGDRLTTNKDLLIELSDQAKEYVKSRNEIFYEDEIIEGDFTHLKVSQKNNLKYEFGLNFHGCDKNGNETLVTYQINPEKRNAKFAEKREELDYEREKLINKGLTKDEAHLEIRKQWDANRVEMDKDKTLMDKRDFGSLFITLTSSVDVIDILLSMGSTVTEL